MKEQKKVEDARIEVKMDEFDSGYIRPSEESNALKYAIVGVIVVATVGAAYYRYKIKK